MLAKVEKLYENVTIMIGEHRSTATGGNTVRITFSPEARERSFKASAAKKLGEAANSALSLENDLDELRATIEEVTAERDRLAATQVTLVTKTPLGEIDSQTEIIQVEPDESAIKPVELEDGDEIVVSRESEKATEEDKNNAFGEAEVAAAEASSLETSQPPVPLAEEVKPSREEVYRLSRLAQTEILREIITHPDFTHSGRLEGHNVSAIIGELVKNRTGMSDKQWQNTYKTLRMKKFIILSTYKDRPKVAYAARVDLELVANAIEIGGLFTSEEDALFKEHLSELRAKKTQRVSDVGQSQTQTQVIAKAEPAQNPVSPATPPPPVIAAVAPSSRPPVALPKSGALRRAERYEQRQREEAIAAQRQVEGVISGIRQRSNAEVSRRDDTILPSYEKISEAEWKVMNGDNDLKLLVALITDKTGETQAELLRIVVEAGRIDIGNDSKKLADIIKRLKNTSRPKIEFTPADKTEDGMLRLELTEAGKEDLATQFRKVQLAVIRAKEAQAPSQAA